MQKDIEALYKYLSIYLSNLILWTEITPESHLDKVTIIISTTVAFTAYYCILSNSCKWAKISPLAASTPNLNQCIIHF